MDSGYYAAFAGLVARTQALDTAASNLANTQTTGYRAEREYFRSVLLDPLGSDAQTGGFRNSVRRSTTSACWAATMISIKRRRVYLDGDGQSCSIWRLKGRASSPFKRRPESATPATAAFTAPATASWFPRPGSRCFPIAICRFPFHLGRFPLARTAPFRLAAAPWPWSASSAFPPERN